MNNEIIFDYQMFHYKFRKLNKKDAKQLIILRKIFFISLLKFKNMTFKRTI